MPAPDVTGLILAGGRSRRFGADKAATLIDGRTMIERVYAALAAVADPVWVSVADPATRYPIPARHLVDAAPGRGPLEGLRTGLAAATTDRLLVVACDLPFLTPEALRLLLREPGADAVVAREPGGRAQPLCACYARRLLPIVETQVRDGRLAVRALLDRLGVVYITLPGDALRNVNAPGDLPG